MRTEADRALAELAEAEAVLERRVIARAALAEALAAPEPDAGEPPCPVPVPAVVRIPVAGSVVPHWREGLTVDALAPGYQQLVGVLERRRAGRGCGLGN